MKQYLVVPDAKQRSQLEAMKRGAGLQDIAVTKFWHSWIRHPVTAEEAIVIQNEADKEFLSATELATLLTYAEMENADWFITFEEEE